MQKLSSKGGFGFSQTEMTGEGEGYWQLRLVSRGEGDGGLRILMEKKIYVLMWGMGSKKEKQWGRDPSRFRSRFLPPLCSMMLFPLLYFNSDLLSPPCFNGCGLVFKRRR